ncbi:MAG: S41 family peptidase [Longimicrobiales bacterium]
MRLRRSYLLVLLVPAFLGGFLVRDMAPRDGARLFSQVVSRVAGTAVDSLGADEIYERAARGLVEQLDDRYADLYSPEELAAFSRQALGNDYGGVGMQIEDQQGLVRVTKVFPGTPAERGGVQTGDAIVTVDGESTQGLRLDEVSERLLGTPGSEVAVDFRRPGVPQPIAQRFVRARVHIPAVPYVLLLDDDIGYVPLQRFNQDAAREVAEAVNALRMRGARSYVLDLRGNPGGDLDQAVAVSNVFLDRGERIASVRYRGAQEDIHVASDTPVSTSEPLVVLVDEYSASASEIVAGSLQDHDRALLLGRPTFGKGVVQSLFPLDDGWGLKLTTARWYTPSGRSIQRDHSDSRDRSATTAQPAPEPATAETPIYYSDAGRPLQGGGGITPDRIVMQDTTTHAEQALLRMLAPYSQQAYVALYEMAVAHRETLQPGFSVDPSWRAEWLERIQAAGLRLTPAQLEGTTAMLDRLIEQRMAAVAFGDSAAFRRTLPTDAALRQAIALLATGATQQELLARAERSPTQPS